ncbi:MULTISPECIES: FMN-dependent NADH-azoreductase [unclassified Crossiella]|uniref:FMN-dependent NADH-azoreductase n=1 Tax=unclassified Crossiella TaxID=2620835 RepID=UPI001FFF2D41|nr:MULTISPECIES: NAD(P)H-dependent oxidoreductase [unclassified Crossiella]MCK2241912.1 NAD(P)H-dependent oxidoreductase [Crossiella sp. S99.2]MCK2255815.1 NAD(P)H-dependent oxidoreductase [Crossiella sp. S99.1]
MTLLRVDTSIRTEGSVSRALGDTFEQNWLAARPGTPVRRRDVGRHPLPADVWPQSVSTVWTPAEEWTDEQRAAAKLATELADELLGADGLLLTAPLYNFGVPTQAKAWIDLLLTEPRLSPAKGQQPLKGRPAALIVARGGGYGPGTPREGWDHGTPWLHRILHDVFAMDVRVVDAELTLADVNPAMAELRELAAQSREQAHTLAGKVAPELAGIVAA